MRAPAAAGLTLMARCKLCAAAPQADSDFILFKLRFNVEVITFQSKAPPQPTDPHDFDKRAASGAINPAAMLGQRSSIISTHSAHRTVLGCRVGWRTRCTAAERQDAAPCEPPAAPPPQPEFVVSDSVRVMNQQLASELRGKTILGPLTRGGNLPFRRLCADFGAEVRGARGARGMCACAQSLWPVKGQALNSCLTPTWPSQHTPESVQPACLQPLPSVTPHCLPHPCCLLPGDHVRDGVCAQAGQVSCAGGQCRGHSMPGV